MNYLLQQLGLKNLSADEAAHLSQLAEATIINRVGLRAVEQVGLEAEAQLRQIIATGSIDDLDQFLASRHINLNQLIDAEIEAYRQEILAAEALLLEPTDG